MQFESYTFSMQLKSYILLMQLESYNISSWKAISF